MSTFSLRDRYGDPVGTPFDNISDALSALNRNHIAKTMVNAAGDVMAKRYSSTRFDPDAVCGIYLDPIEIAQAVA